MKILHLCLDTPYNDYWGYQDNLLPKYQKKMGHSVTVITTNTMHRQGEIVEIACDRYCLNDGEEIIRLDYKNVGIPPFRILKRKFDIYSYLIELRPDYIFSHGLLNVSFLQVIKYKKNINSKCVIVQDNHADYNIGRGTQGLKNKIARLYYRLLNKKTQKYVSKVFGVTPWRKKYAEDYYQISPKLTDVLIMGADDEQMDLENRGKYRKEIRNKYCVQEEEFLIVTGGKIDKKKKIDILMEACISIPKVKLLVFGEIQEDIKNRIKAIKDKSTNIIDIGWIGADEVYKFFYAADLCFFPGQHSVLWEQACASKVPCVFKKWEGMEHVNNGGNAEFLEEISKENIREKINQLMFTDEYYRMKEVAESSSTDIYLYSRIAKKSLEIYYTEMEKNQLKEAVR